MGRWLATITMLYKGRHVSVSPRSSHGAEQELISKRDAVPLLYLRIPIK